MEENKNKISISLSTIIIITFIVGALIAGLASFLIYTLIKDDSEPTISKNYQEQSAEKTQFSTSQSSSNKINSSSKTDVPTSSNSSLEENLLDKNTSSNEQNSSNKTDIPASTNSSSDKQNNSSEADVPHSSSPSTQNSSNGASSSKQNPASIGQWSIASNYISGEYVNIPVRIIKVTRGSSAAQEVKNYLSTGSSIYKYEDAKSNMEWAVIDYEVDLTKITKDSRPDSISKAITGTGDNSSINYNGTIYITSPINITPVKYAKGTIESCKFAVQLPIGCTDYLIKFGSYGNTQAFFSGV